jgi:hypothetical protein
MTVAPGQLSQLLYTPHPGYTHLWDRQIHLTLLHYALFFTIIWVLRSRLAMHLDDGERRERRRLRKTGSRTTGRREQKRPF